MTRAAKMTLVALLALATGPVARASADPPTLAITSPASESTINTATPTFRGTSSEGEGFFPALPVTVEVYRGRTPGGKPVDTAEAVEPGREWEAVAAKPLEDGIYTAEAEQEGLPPLEERGRSSPVTFTIDTVPPQVTISSPANGSAAGGEVVTYAGTAGTAHGDAAAVTLEIFAGAAIGSQPPVQTHVVQAASGAWSVPVAGLGSGAYTARATQSDAAGNRGFSMPVTVTFPSPPPAPVPQPPSASFRWFPQTPTVGQSVAFVSNSTDLTSPINSFAWDLAGNGVFKAAGPVVTTTFTTPGPHTVHLRIGDARGATSVATATIPVSRVPLSLMQPFPIVRIAGTETATGVKLSQLAVQTPIGARVTVSCRGHGCHRRSQSQLARASRRRHTSSVVLVFPGFQRALRAGVVLEIRVAHSGEIGKYTRFLIRRRHIPARFDACLASFNPRPITCPS